MLLVKVQKNKLEDNHPLLTQRRVKPKDVVTYYGIKNKKIFSSEPRWLVTMITNGELWLDDSDEKLYLYTTERGKQVVGVEDIIYLYTKGDKAYVDCVEASYREGNRWASRD